MFWIKKGEIESELQTDVRRVEERKENVKSFLLMRRMKRIVFAHFSSLLIGQRECVVEVLLLLFSLRVLRLFFFNNFFSYLSIY